MVLWGGCGMIRGAKSIICGRERRLRWYVTKGGGVEWFLVEGVKVKFMILDQNNGCCDDK